MHITAQNFFSSLNSSHRKKGNEGLNVNDLFRLCSGICGKSQQTETYSGHIAPQSGEADRVPDALPHGSFRGRAVQRREGVSD